MAWTLRLPTDLEARLQSFCQSQGAVKQRVVALALDSYLEEQSRPRVFPSGPLEDLAEEPFMPRTLGMLEAESPVLDAVSPDVRENVEKTPFRRDKKCVHMAEPEDFCPVCDSGVT